jgi:hypothetical protein
MEGREMHSNLGHKKDQLSHWLVVGEAYWRALTRPDSSISLMFVSPISCSISAVTVQLVCCCGSGASRDIVLIRADALALWASSTLSAHLMKADPTLPADRTSSPVTSATATEPSTPFPESWAPVPCHLTLHFRWRSAVASTTHGARWLKGWPDCQGFPSRAALGRPTWAGPLQWKT